MVCGLLLLILLLARSKDNEELCMATDKVIYDNFVEWKEPPSFQDWMKLRQIKGLEVSEATQEEWDQAVHQLQRNIGD